MTKVDYIDLIEDIEKSGSNIKNEMVDILCRYNISNIENLERRVMKYISSLEDIELKIKMINKLLKTNNLYIMQQCKYIRDFNISQNKYVEGKFKNKCGSRFTLTNRYLWCMETIKIIDPSFSLEEKQNEDENESKFLNDSTKERLSGINHNNIGKKITGC